MYTEKEKVLAEAPAALNKPDQPWEVTVEGDTIVARWKWMDATFFSPSQVTNKTKAYTFTVTLKDNGKWKELDKTQSTSSGAGMRSGRTGFGSTSTFIGKTSQKSISFGIGKNNQTGETGVIGFKFDTTKVKQPIREYLTKYGWKKAGLFG